MITFDTSRIMTVISPTGKVHITKHHGEVTLCSIVLVGIIGRSGWWENIENKQPTCKSCINQSQWWMKQGALR